MQRQWLAVIGVAAVQSVAVAQEPDSWLALATDAARWIEAHAVETTAGVTWPADPEHDAHISTTLYAGSPGVILFFLELHQATGDERLLERARLGALDLASAVDDPDTGVGLYTGLGGLAFTLGRAADMTGDGALDDAARDAIDRMHALAEATEAGASWGPVTDIVSGDAGAGLALLWAHERWDDARDLDLAISVGRHLQAIARPTHAGLSWPMAPDFPRVMPNFSHGTAGVAFFLERLAGVTEDASFRRTALEGTRQLLALTEMGLIHHHTPGGEELFYLGWCHGPAGTVRLYDLLHEHTGDATWRALARSAHRAVLETGAPEQRSDGYWENVGVCCGSAGIASALLDTWQLTGEAAWREAALRFGEDIRQRATRDDGLAYWVQAEHRARPELLVAQTGYMQGAAGIGLLLLRLDAIERGREWTLRLPDDPMAGVEP